MPYANSMQSDIASVTAPYPSHYKIKELEISIIVSGRTYRSCTYQPRKGSVREQSNRLGLTNGWRKRRSRLGREYTSSW